MHLYLRLLFIWTLEEEDSVCVFIQRHYLNSWVGVTYCLSVAFYMKCPEQVFGLLWAALGLGAEWPHRLVSHKAQTNSDALHFFWGNEHVWKIFTFFFFSCLFRWSRKGHLIEFKWVCVCKQALDPHLSLSLSLADEALLYNPHSVDCTPLLECQQLQS